MHDDVSDERNRRRHLRLGALLYRLHYYADPTQRDAEGQIALYRHEAGPYVEVSSAGVRLVSGGADELLDLDGAIARCREALDGQPFHRSSGDQR